MEGVHIVWTHRRVSITSGHIGKTKVEKCFFVNPYLYSNNIFNMFSIR